MVFGALRKKEPADRPGYGRAIFFGFVILIFFVGGFLVWASVAPLDSAAVAGGTVIVDTNRKTVQHLEGGIIGEILVRDGDQVEAGQVVVRLDDTQPSASLELLKGRQTAALALEARLIAERDDRREIEFSDALMDDLDTYETIEAVAGQTNLFNARREALFGQVDILNQRIAQTEKEIVGLEGEIAAATRQLELIGEEIADVSTLVSQGLARRPRLLELERQAADIEGERSRNVAAVARARNQIGEAELRIQELHKQRTNEVLEQLRDVQTELYDVAERISAARDVLARTEIRAPLSGRIVGLAVHTAGGVIGSGEPLMDIVPKDDRLIVEARVSPMDIDVVERDLPAQVRFTAFSQRSFAPLDGVVTQVSADVITDPATGELYYKVRVEISEDIPLALDGGSLYPGMPAEVMIVTGERTALDYILKPLEASVNRAFRED